MELEQIVDDVDDMYREQSRRSRYDLCNLSSAGMSANSFRTHDLIRRNAIATNGGGILSHLLNRSSQDVANEIARSLVDKALENDRRKLMRGRGRLSGDKLFQEEELVVENYVEVSVNRTFEFLVTELLDKQVNDVANTLYYGCGGNVSELLRTEKITGVDYLQSEMESVVKLLTAHPTSGTALSFGLHRAEEFRTTCDDYALSEVDDELNEQMRELTKSGERWRGSGHACSEVCVQRRKEREAAEEEEAERRREAAARATKQALPPAKKEDERRKRNSLGILLSSLQEKVYHCRCVDCQEERRAEGKPEPEVSIEVKELEMPEVPEDVRIVIPRTKKRGRPRIFPRLEDLLQHGRTAAADNGSGEKQMLPPPSPPPKRAATVKRPRGRPRKYQVGHETKKTPREGPTASVRESTDGKLVLTIKNHRAVIPERSRSAMKMKTKKRKSDKRKRRKRGRPRKRSVSEEESEEYSEETTDDSDLDDEAIFGTKVTRSESRVSHERLERPTRVSAGRNLKRFLDMEEEDDDLDGSEEKEEDEDSLFIPLNVAPAAFNESKLERQREMGNRPTGKRRPGRPRKYPLPAPPIPHTPSPPPSPTHTAEISLNQEGSIGAGEESQVVSDSRETVQQWREDSRGPLLPPPRCDNGPLFSGLSEGSALSGSTPPPSDKSNGGRNEEAGPNVVGSGRGRRAWPPSAPVSPPPLPLPSAISGLGGGGGGRGAGLQRRLTRSSSSPSSSPSKRWSELHEEQLPFAMVDDEPDADQENAHNTFHLKREDIGGGGAFVTDCNGNRTDRQKLESLGGYAGPGGGGRRASEAERYEKTSAASSPHLRPLEFRGRRSVSSEVATIRPSPSNFASSSFSSSPRVGERVKSVGASEGCIAPGLTLSEGNGTVAPIISEGVVEPSSQIGSDGCVGGNCSDGGAEEHFLTIDDSGNAAVKAAASEKPLQTRRSSDDNANTCDNHFQIVRDPITLKGEEKRLASLEETSSTTNLQKKDVMQASRDPMLTSPAEATKGGNETADSEPRAPRDHKKEEQRERNRAARRTFRVNSEESASRLIDRLSGIVKQLNAKLGQSRCGKCGHSVDATEEGIKNPLKSWEGTLPLAIGPFSRRADATATAMTMQRRMNRPGQTSEGARRKSKGEKALLFLSGAKNTATSARFPRGRGEKERRITASSSLHSSSSPEECQERGEGNETDPDSRGGGDKNESVSMRDSNRLPTSISQSRWPEEAGIYNEDGKNRVRGESGLQSGGGDTVERGREPFEMMRKLERRGAGSGIRAEAGGGEEGATEDDGSRRMPMDERKAVKERGEEDHHERDREKDHYFTGCVRDEDDVGGDDMVTSADTEAGLPQSLSVSEERPMQKVALGGEPSLAPKEEWKPARAAGEIRPPARRRRLPLPPEPALYDGAPYSLPGWSGIRLGSSFIADRDRALVSEDSSAISSVSNISILATSGQKLMKGATE